MGKKTSVAALIAMSILIAVMCFVCLIPFEYGTNNLHRFNSVLEMTDKDMGLGGYYASENEGYNGGGLTAVYYPEGVISARQYADDLAGKSDADDIQEYKDKYVACGSLYLEREVACVKNSDEISEDFTESFANAAALMRDKVARLHVNGARVEVADGFTLRVSLPYAMDSQSFVFTALASMGELTVKFGSDEASAETIMPARPTDPITDYVKGAGAATRQGTPYVDINLTKKGREILKNVTTAEGDAAPTGNLYIYVGETAIITLSVTDTFDSSTLYVTSDSYTTEVSRAVAASLDTSIHGVQTELEFSIKEMYRFHATYGENALTLLYVAFGVCFVGMMAYFAVRYRVLAFAHLFSYALFLFPMILCMWAISFVQISVETVVAVLLAGLMLSFSNALFYERTKKEFAAGKTLRSAAKAGYKRSFWLIFDLHIAVALLSFMIYFIALTPLSTFAFTLGLATAFSGVCSLAINRLSFECMTAFSRKAHTLCNFKREVSKDED